MSQAKLAPKQLNLNKLSDAGGLKVLAQPTQSKTNSSGYLGIYEETLTIQSKPRKPFVDKMIMKKLSH